MAEVSKTPPRPTLRFLPDVVRQFHEMNEEEGHANYPTPYELAMARGRLLNPATPNHPLRGCARLYPTTNDPRPMVLEIPSVTCFLAETDRIAASKAEAERVAAEKAEAERLLFTGQPSTLQGRPGTRHVASPGSGSEGCPPRRRQCSEPAA